MNVANPRLYGILGRMENIIPRVIRQGCDFGKPEVLPKREVVVIDFSSPNIGKPFHLGHFRATVTGHFIRNINEFMGHEVIAINFLGDFGRQFGLLAEGYQKFGNRADLDKYGTKHLFEVYAKMHSNDRSRRLNDGEENEPLDPAYFSQLWKEFREISLTDLMDTYKRMGIEFTAYHYESDYVGAAKRLSTELLRTSYADDTPNGIVLRDAEGVVRLLTAEGYTLYLSRDIAAAIHRVHLYDYDRIHYVVGENQARHFMNMQLCLRNLGYGEYVDRSQPWGLHIPFGQVIGQSTRKGTVVFLQDILDLHAHHMKKRLLDHRTRIPDDLDNVARILSWSVICEAIFKYPRKKPVGVRFQDGSEGIRLQYCYARINTLIEDATEKGIEPVWDQDAWITMAKNDSANQFMLTLLEFENVVLDSYETFEGFYIVHYMRKLSSKTNSCIRDFRVIDNPDISKARANLAMFVAARQVLQNCFKLLGIKPLQKL